MILCNLSSEVGNCSDLFDGIGVPITVVQAFFAAIVIAVSVPMNLLLITASHQVYRSLSGQLRNCTTSDEMNCECCNSDSLSTTEALATMNLLVQ